MHDTAVYISLFSTAAVTFLPMSPFLLFTDISPEEAQPMEGAAENTGLPGWL